MKLLDLYCGGGGAAMGYYRAGFTQIVGIDVHPIRTYPFDFVQGDALNPPVDVQMFDAIHASPPCQAFSMMQRIHKNRDEHPDLINPTRSFLLASGKPFVIENVEGAPLRVDLRLCGTMFGLPIIRHRIFESNVPMPILMPPCNHHRGIYDPFHRNQDHRRFKAALEIDWLPSGGGRRKGSLSDAIPPTYTEWIGKILAAQITGIGVH